MPEMSDDTILANGKYYINLPNNINLIYLSSVSIRKWKK